jgi:DNA-directed RNA polymerase specialized sigma24 family protein
MASELLEERMMSPSTSTTTFDDLFETGFHNGYINTRRFLQSKGADRDLAEEIAQAAWTRGWERRAQLRCPELLGSWVNSIAMNLWRNHIIGSRRFGGLKEDILIFPKIDQEMDAAVILKSCLSGESQMLQYYYFDGMSTEEIAARSRCRPVTVRVRLMRLREALRSRLGLDKSPARTSSGVRNSASRDYAK